MTEFTSEFIAEQRKIIDNAPTKSNMLAGINKSFIVAAYGYDPEYDQYDYSQFGECGNSEDAEFIYHSCLHYPKALDHIEQQAKRIEELEHYKRLNEEWVREKVEGLTSFEEIEKMVMIADKLNKSNASIRCGWCDAEYDTRDQVKEHAFNCKDNPLAQRIAELEQERRWIPVSESKPELDKNSNEDGTINVLVYIKNYKRILEATYYPKMAVWNMPYGWGDETDNITHWMIAIPHPPKDGE